MKISKILAGMSAAAIAGSMLTMVSASAVSTATAEDFGAQVYAMGGTSWSWQSVDTKFTADATLTLTGDAAAIAEACGDDAIGDTGVQFYLGDTVTLATNETATATFDYTLKGEDGEIAKVGTETIDFTKAEASKSLSLFGNGSDWASFTALGNFTLTATVSDITVAESEESSSEADPTDEGKIYASGGTTWNGVKYDSLKNVEMNQWDGGWLQFDYNKEGYTADASAATIVFQIDNAKASYGEADPDGAYAKGDPRDVIAGDILFRYIYTSDDTTFFKAAEDTQSSYTVEIPYTDFVASMYKQLGDDTDKVWDGGLGTNLQYGVAGTMSVYLEGVTYTANPEESEPDGDETTYAYAFAGANFTGWYPAPVGYSKDITLEENVANGNNVAITGNGDYTLDVTPADAFTGFGGNWIDFVGMYAAYPDAEVELTGMSVTDADGNTTDVALDMTETRLSDEIVLGDMEAPVEGLIYGNIEDDTDNYRVEISNEYGKTNGSTNYTTLAATAGSTYSYTFTVSGLPEEPVDSTPESEPESESTSESDSTADSTSTSTTDSKASSSSKAGTSTTTTSNPSTGAAALAVVGVALAGAAVVATKKRK